MPNPQEKTCGNCENFDLYRMVDSAKPNEPREPVGTIDLAQGEINLGFCRAERGLTLGARPEASNCGLVPSAFKAKEVVLFPDLQSIDNKKKVSVPGF